jgi:hypothetical protein
MEMMLRRSPVVFRAKPAAVEQREGWQVVLRYQGEEDRFRLIDLSHRRRWDVQDANLAKIRPRDLVIPEKPGQSVLQDGWLINRMNRTQAALWHFGEQAAEPGGEACFTETTEATALLAVMGKNPFSLMEKMTALDLSPPQKSPPFMIPGPVLHIPCQIAVLGEKQGTSGLLLAFSRAYGQSMAEALLDAGVEFGLHPGGEAGFLGWIGL